MIVEDIEFKELMESDSTVIIALNRADYYRVQTQLNKWLDYINFEFYQDLKNYIENLESIENQKIIIHFMPPFIKSIFDKGFKVFIADNNKICKVNLEECKKYFDI